MTSTTDRTARRTPADRCRYIVERIANITGEAWTFGYIGNVDRYGDGRGWYAFRPHPGRAGTAADRIGGHGTEDLDKLEHVLAGAYAMARMTTPEAELARRGIRPIAGGSQELDAICTLDHLDPARFEAEVATAVEMVRMAPADSEALAASYGL